VPDIITAVQKQNTVNPAGQVGGEPIPSGQKFTYTVRAQGRLQTPEEFGEIVVRANADGSFVRVKDIARIDLGAQTYNLKRQAQRTTRGDSRCVSAARNQRRSSRASRAQANGGSEATFSGGHGFRRLAGSNPLGY
jgi:Cation/multidrug efflux pump